MAIIMKALESERFSDISQDIAQVLFASAFIEPIVNGKNANWQLITVGFAVSMLFWIVSLRNDFA